MSGTSELPIITTTSWSQPKKTRVKNIRRDASGIMKDLEVVRMMIALIGKLMAFTMKMRSIGSTLLSLTVYLQVKTKMMENKA